MELRKEEGQLLARLEAMEPGSKEVRGEEGWGGKGKVWTWWDVRR